MHRQMRVTRVEAASFLAPAVAGEGKFGVWTFRVHFWLPVSSFTLLTVQRPC